MKGFVLFSFLLLMTSFFSCENGGDTSRDDASPDDTDDIVTADEETLLSDETAETEIPDADFSVIEGDLECGENDLFWIYDLSSMPPQNVQICAHVRSEGNHVRVLVADDVWGTRVTADTVRTLLKAWEIETPADPRRGIFSIVTGLFGPVPDEFDGYPGLYLFLYEMAGYSGHSFDGYFRIDDQYDGDYSNRREMIHINVAEGKDPTSAYMLSVQAHEFQHLIHWGRDKNEEAWLNEAMSELAMVVTRFGTDEAWVNNWLATPTEPLMSGGPAYDYGVLLLFGTYLYDRFGATFITNLVADTANGRSSIEAALSTQPQPITFPELGADFALAVLAQDTTYDDGRFGFTSISPSRKAASKKVESSTKTTVNANGGMAFFRIENYHLVQSPVVSFDGNGTLVGRVAYLDTEEKILEINTVILNQENTSVTLSSDMATAATAYIALFNPGETSTAVTVTLP